MALSRRLEEHAGNLIQLNAARPLTPKLKDVPGTRAPVKPTPIGPALHRSGIRRPDAKPTRRENFS
jgi:hypothetical protein